MGLDLAEMVMDIEDAFGIVIPDDVLLTSTVGELTDFVRQQLEENHERKCYSGFCFYRLREALCTVSGRDKRTIRPSTALIEIVAAADPSVFYRDVRNALGEYKKLLSEFWCGLRVPEHPLSIAVLCSGFSLIVMSIAGLPIPWWISVPAPILILVMAEMIESRMGPTPGSIFYRSSFPRMCTTVGDVARVMATKLTPEEMGGALPLPSEIETRVKTIIAQIINVPVEKIKNTDRFVQDLGMD